MLERKQYKKKDEVGPASAGQSGDLQQLSDVADADSESVEELVEEGKRKPVAEGTIEDWERTLKNWINPNIGDCPVRDVNNGVLKRLVAVMARKGLSPKSIENYIQVPKMVVASVVDEDGNQVYPRKWNHEFIDMPVIEQSEQNRPSFSSEIMAGLAKYRRPREQMLFVFAGAGGLRIGEALGIEIDKHLSADA